MEQLLIDEIVNIAKRYDNINKVVLFGSRVRGDNTPRSDIDLCVYSDTDIFDFESDINEETDTLLTFDITRMQQGLDSEFVNQIETEGITIYEKS